MELFHSDRIAEKEFALILSILQRGGVIGFPTDTAYGLGADPFNIDAVERIFRMKGRSTTKPLLLLVNSVQMAKRLSKPAPFFDDIVRRFWPGPLTLILPAAERVPVRVTAGTHTVGIRWPVAAFANALIDRLGQPITATSANRSGMPSAITAKEVRMQLGNELDALIDGGTLPSRTGSSLLDLTVEPPVLVREGPISFETLYDFLNGKIRRGIV